MTEPIDALLERVTQFMMMELPGQLRMMHMGTSYLVNDLASAIRELRQRPATVPREPTREMIVAAYGAGKGSWPIYTEAAKSIWRAMYDAAHPQADEAQRAMPPGPTSSASTAAAEGAVGSAGTHAELCASSSVVAHMRYLAYDPCANGYQPIFPRTLREWADRIESLARQVAERDAEIMDWRNATARNDPDDCRAGIKQLYDNWQRAEAAAAANAKDAECLQAMLPELRKFHGRAAMEYAGDCQICIAINARDLARKEGE